MRVTIPYLAQNDKIDPRVGYASKGWWRSRWVFNVFVFESCPNARVCSYAISRHPPLIFFLFLSPPTPKQVVEVFDAGEGALRFTFHTPFTAAGKVHGSTAEQCKKLTELEVRKGDGA